MILAITIMIAFMSTGTRSTLGVFFKSIIADLQWDRGTISLVVAVNIWLSGLLQPFTGHVMDRFGAKWLFTVSLAIYGIGIALISLTQSVGYLLLVYGVIAACATAGASISLTNALLAQWFSDARRGLAIGLNNMGSAMGQLALVPISAMLLSTLGWRKSELYLGLAVIVVTVPALLIPRQRQAEEGSAAASGRPPARQGPLSTASWSEALRSMPLWQINAGYFVCGMSVAIYSTHLIPFATDRGFSNATAVTTFSLLVASSAVGALIAGAISDRIGPQECSGPGLLCPCPGLCGAVGLAPGGGVVRLRRAWRPVVVGHAWIGHSAHRRSIWYARSGHLSGISLLAHQIGGGASVWLAGELHDLTGNYDISLS